MNEENTRKLFTDFDRLFRGRTEPHSMQSQMCEGFNCRDGWFDLIYDLCVQITKHARKAGLDPKVFLVKQLGGRLNFCCRERDDTMKEICNDALFRSWTICDRCGGYRHPDMDKEKKFPTACANCRDKCMARHSILKKLPKPKESWPLQIKHLARLAKDFEGYPETLIYDMSQMSRERRNRK